MKQLISYLQRTEEFQLEKESELRFEVESGATVHLEVCSRLRYEVESGATVHLEVCSRLRYEVESGGNSSLRGSF